MKKTTINSQVPFVAIIITDHSRHILHVNENFTEITGYDLEEIKGEKPAFLQGRDTKKETIDRIRKNLELGTPFKEEIVNYRKNGEKYPCKLVIHPIHNEKSELTNFIAFEVDGNQVKDDSHLSIMDPKTKFSPSQLSDVEELDLFVKFKTLLDEEKLYLDSDLKLVDVAHALNSNTSYLSKVINQQAGQNFQYMINEYRVNAFKEKVRETDFNRFTILSVANECGFKNKSTFYRVYKNFTGENPKQFIARLSADGIVEDGQQAMAS